MLKVYKYSLYTGHTFSSEVIRHIGPVVNQCECVSDLAIYLHQRHVLNPAEYKQLTQSSITGGILNHVLVQASQEETRGEDLISKLFLALLDMFFDTGNSWCHHTAFKVVRKYGMYKIYICV